MSSTLTVTNLTATNLTDGAGTTSTFANVASGSAKMWISFNGTGTPAIYESLNVSSLTDVSTGRFLGNFSNSFSSSTYNVSQGAGQVDRFMQYQGNSTAVSYLDMRVTDAATSYADVAYNSSSVTGDLA